MRLLPRLRANRSLLAGIFLLAVALAFALFVLPGIMVSSDDVPRAHDRLKLQNDVRATLLQAVGGVVLVTGAYFTARNLQITRETRDIDREHQITDRFSNAIEQLGDDGHRDVRVGGIYSLERIAQDSPRDHSQIVDVLATFVRAHAPLTSTTQDDDQSAREVSGHFDRRDILPGDLQAALAVLGRRKLESDPPNFRLYLSGSRLAGAYLNWSSLPRTRFQAADLTSARFYRSNLQQADFSSASLDAANFNLASLPSAVFSKARLVGARFAAADLTGAYFRGANLTDAYLAEANLCGANLAATLDRTNFKDACYDDTTVWPSGFDPALFGAISASTEEAAALQRAAVERHLQNKEQPE